MNRLRSALGARRRPSLARAEADRVTLPGAGEQVCQSAAQAEALAAATNRIAERKAERHGLTCEVRSAKAREIGRRVQAAGAQFSQWLCQLRGHGQEVCDHDHGRPVYRCLACFRTRPRSLPWNVW